LVSIDDLQEGPHAALNGHMTDDVSFFLGRNFVSGLICTLKSKKPKKNFFSKKQGFSSPGIVGISRN